MFKRILLSLAVLASLTSTAQFSGNALDFDGTNDMVVCNTVPACFAAPASSDFTIEAWVNPRASLFQRILFAQPATNNFASLGTGAGNVIYFYVIENGVTYSVATSTSIPQNQWTHVAARWTTSSNSVQVFFNGVLQSGVAGGGSSTGTSGLMVLGARAGGGTQHFNGALDEVRVWSEARTDCEIQNNYTKSITGVQTNLQVNYDFNQGVAGGNNTGITTLTDNSGNNFNGTITNFTLTAATSNFITSGATVTTQGNPVNGVVYSETFAVCSGGSYTFPDGTTQTNITSQVVHVSSIVGGCDTTITTTVNVNPVYAITDTAWICNGMDYTFPDGTSFIAVVSPMTHTSTISTIAGCDSVITRYLDLYPTYAQTDSVAVCPGDSITFPDGSVLTGITSPTSHASILTTVNGCDSVITTDVSVNPVYMLMDTAWICYGGSYTFPDGTTFTGITSPTSQTSSFSTINACDSVIETYVDIIQVDTGVTMVNETLTAAASGATYQWLDCGNGYAPLAGDTNQSFTATVNGNYALAVTVNGCTDTTMCYAIISTGVDPAEGEIRMSMFPNPAGENFTVTVEAEGRNVLEIFDVTGKVIMTQQFTGKRADVNVASLAAGTYFVRVTTTKGIAVNLLQKN